MYVFPIERDVDILFVIDNSGSMGEEQANLARNFGSLLDELESVHVRANYRIAFTTTDNGNPWCSDTTPEGGKLVLSSCRGRIEDFVFGSGGNVDDRTSACLDHCPPELAEIEIRPTTTWEDPVPAPRRWIESRNRITNLPTGVGTAEAMSCFGPQGVDGCGFESPLESMYKALARTRTASEASYGFLRDTAILAVVIVTDETDCSYNADWTDEIFGRDGPRTFWSVPEAGNPTSAVCWNAGVQCSGGPGTYDECHAIDRDVLGNAVDGHEASRQAALRPVQRYIDILQRIEGEKRIYDAHSGVLVALIAGVPLDYPESPIVYADAPDGTQNAPNFQNDFGVGPGCSSPNGEAVPPVRERELAEAFALPGEDNVFSVCSEDYAPALHAIAKRIRDRIHPACMTTCVADTEPSRPGLDERCTLERKVPYDDGSTRVFPVPKCSDEDGTIPEGALSCYLAIDVANDPLASRRCVESGANLEFVLVHAPGPEIVGMTWAECEPSKQPEIDCPDLLD